MCDSDQAAQYHILSLYALGSISEPAHGCLQREVKVKIIKHHTRKMYVYGGVEV
jgi:hypothetical protein